MNDRTESGIERACVGVEAWSRLSEIVLMLCAPCRLLALFLMRVASQACRPWTSGCVLRCIEAFLRLDAHLT